MNQQTYLGFDCSQPAPAILPTVTARYGPVAFVGRYLMPLPDIGVTALNAAEATALHQAGKAILLCYNGATGETVQTAIDGSTHAIRAVNAAKALAVPHATALFLDLEAGFTPTVPMLVNYFHFIRVGGYRPGVYLNALEAAHVQPYLMARGADTLVWSSEPEPDADWDVRLGSFYDFSQTLLAPAVDDVVLWQYGEGEVGDTVDLDLCTQRGWDALWRPQPSGVRRRVIRTCGLKPVPVHGGRNLAEIPAHGQVFDFGRPSGVWSAVQYRDLHGFVLTHNLEDIPGGSQ